MNLAELEAAVLELSSRVNHDVDDNVGVYTEDDHKEEQNDHKATMLSLYWRIIDMQGSSKHTAAVAQALIHARDHTNLHQLLAQHLESAVFLKNIKAKKISG